MYVIFGWHCTVLSNNVIQYVCDFWLSSVVHYTDYSTIVGVYTVLYSYVQYVTVQSTVVRVQYFTYVYVYPYMYSMLVVWVHAHTNAGDGDVMHGSQCNLHSAMQYGALHSGGGVSHAQFSRSVLTLT